MTTRSELAATWLLKYLNDLPHFDSIMGDLEEFRSEGRSQGWYWRQTLVAVASHFVRNIRNHKLLACRGLVVAWALMPAYNVGRLLAVKASVAGWSITPLLDFRRTPALHLFETSFQEIPRALAAARSAGSPHFVAAWAILVLIALIFGTATSLVVGRLHSQHHKTIIALYALTMLISVLPNAGSLAFAAYTSRRLGTVLHVIIYCVNNTALITGIVVGGFRNQRRQGDPKDMSPHTVGTTGKA